MAFYTPSFQRLFLFAALACLNLSLVVARRSYIIVGGGPAGYVVAERLSRAHDVTVTLFEAGPDAQDDPMVNSMSSNATVFRG